MKKIGVFCSGGDAPGMNAAIRAVVRSALARDVEVVGFIRGYNGLIEGKTIPMTYATVSNIIQRGGTILKTARSQEFMTKEGRATAFANLQAEGVEGLIAIGGNGTFTGAKVFLEEHSVPTIGIPGTIDNDLFGTDFTIGFDTAVNTALDAIDRIRDTADSHDRLFLVEVMGRHAGDIAVAVGIGGGAESVLIPETPTSIEELIHQVQNRPRKKSSYIIIVSEGDELGDANAIAAQVTAAVPEISTRVTVIGHMQRGGSPTAADRVLASRLGVGAVEALLAGEHSKAVGIVNDVLTLTPFEEAITRKKTLNPDLVRIIGVLSQ